MSLMLEFRPPKNRHARSAGIATNWCFPSVSPPTDAAECKGETTSAWEGRRTSDPRVTQGNRRPLVSRSPDRESSTSELPVNDLLTDSGNSD